MEGKKKVGKESWQESLLEIRAAQKRFTEMGLKLYGPNVNCVGLESGPSPCIFPTHTHILFFYNF